MRILFYYNGEENIGVESLSAYLKDKGHTVDLLYDPGFGNNFYLRLPLLNKFITDDMIVEKLSRMSPDLYIGVIFFSSTYPEYIKKKVST